MALAPHRRTAATMADTLIEEIMLRPFKWGRCDCCLAVCDVLVARGYADAAEGFRGVYGSERGARVFTAAGLGVLVDRVCGEMGWPETDPADPQPCDIGILRDFLAIRYACRWVAKTPGGLVTSTRAAARAWRPQFTHS